MSLRINGKDLTADFQSYIAKRTAENPKKKNIKTTVPFSNVVYDFSKIDGEIYYENRNVIYEIDIAELSATEMETKRSQLVNWLFSVFDADIYDPYLSGYHFHGTFDTDGWQEDFEAGILTATFSCYPYKIADTPTTATYSAGTVVINNDSSHPITPTLTATAQMNITIDGSTYSIGAGETTDDVFKLAVGSNTWTISGTGTLTVSFVKEVL